MVRYWFFAISVIILSLVAMTSLLWPAIAWSLVVLLPLFLLGLRDSFQRSHTVLRNFPVIGHGRYFMEMVRPEIQQYFIENNIDAYPIEREFRSIVYQRAKGELETRPFGTQRDVYRVGYEWAAHSMAAHGPPPDEPRVTIGGPDCRRPYEAAVLNISAMSYGALSKNAVLALNRGAGKGNFAHNTGEGGISPYHLEGGGDLIWQIGTGYFGCRTLDGRFDEDRFAEQATGDTVRMIEVKLSQGAKPGHGGVLPGIKVDAEIARIRGVPVGETVVSPPGHTAFSNPIELLQFLARLRALSAGKPVGFKLCVGHRSDVFALCKAMLETGITPDFITVDGGEGGTGAAPLEFSNSLGMPARDAWIFVHGALRGVGLRDRVRLIASGKILTGFHIIRALAVGADLCASARGMMLALGCIQSLRCNTNHCPTGVTTQKPSLVYGLDVRDKTERVYRFQRETVRGALELLGAMGLERLDDLRPEHIFRRIDDLRIRNFGEIYDFLEPGQLLDGHDVPEGMRREWAMSRPDRWTVAPEVGQYGGESLR
ncbi:MAG: FMN-binding glutamate synthase family protein [Gammaproteobacteria bacterium]|nr:FMN-binding glutamate synthase family protein [Gammaproteobacteria bacterium]